MAGDVRVVDTNLYMVTKDTPVQLRVTVGDAQVGGTALRLDGMPVPINPATGVAQIGQPGQDLKRSVLECLTTVQDINPSSNRTSVTYDLVGGPAAGSFPYTISVTADKGLARYFITFLFDRT